MDIEITQASLFIAGRYLKFSRDISNSLWLNKEGQRISSTSVEETVAQSIIPYFKPDSKIY